MNAAWRIEHYSDLPSSQDLALLGKDGLLQQTSDLIPVSQRLSGSGGKPNGGPRSDEGHVEPKGQTVHSSRLQDVKLQGDLDAMQLGFVGGGEIDDMPLSLCQAYPNIKGIDNGLSKVFVHCGFT